jgi:hydroxymethylbilane synthase
MTQPLLRIGTRGSPLALRQAQEVRARLGAAHPELAEEGAVAVAVIRTTGDTVQDRTLAAIGGKGLFTKEIEEALLAGTVDLAVHSMKDVPTFLPEGLAIACILPREDPRDAFFSPLAATLRALPEGAVVGTASLRRQAQLLHLRPDLRTVPLRGNVETRLRKLGEGSVDATLLALAGLKRLGLADRATSILEPKDMLPAVAQGAIGVEIRSGDARVRDYLAALDHAPTALCVAAERALLAALDGSCRTPIAALAEIGADGTLSLRARILRPDGTELHETVRSGRPEVGEALGRDAGEELRRRGGPGYFDRAEPDRVPV